MTEAQFRELTMALPATELGAHAGAPDYRVKKRIFTGLSRDGKIGNLKLRPETQEAVTTAKPGVCYPCEGAWGRAGWTYLVLAGISVAGATLLLAEAHELVSTRRR